MYFPTCCLGCVLAELYTGFPLFPGENEVEQLACIMEILGLPPKDLIANASNRRLFFDSRGNPRCITNSKGRKRTPGTKTLSQVLHCQDRNFINFLQRCLEWDPAERMTPAGAIQHEFLQPSSNRHRSSRISCSSSTNALNNPILTQKSAWYNFAESSPPTSNTSAAVVASITNATSVGNTASNSNNIIINSNTTTRNHITTNTPNNGYHNSATTLLNGNQQSSQATNSTSNKTLPDIKLIVADKYISMQKLAVRSKITASISDLDSPQQYSLHRIYGTAITSNGTLGSSTHMSQSSARKQLFTGTLQPNTSSTASSKYGYGHHNTNNNHNHHHHHHHSTQLTSALTHQHGLNPSSNLNIAHSQSTGHLGRA